MANKEIAEKATRSLQAFLEDQKALQKAIDRKYDEQYPEGSEEHKIYLCSQIEVDGSPMKGADEEARNFAEAIPIKDYKKRYDSGLTHGLMKTAKRDIKTINNDGTITAAIAVSCLNLIDKVVSGELMPLSKEAKRTLLYLINLLTDNYTACKSIDQARRLSIRLSHYMSELGLKDRKHAKDILLRTLGELNRHSLSFDISYGSGAEGKPARYEGTHIVGTYESPNKSTPPRKRGYIDVLLDYDFSSAIIGGGVMNKYPQGMLALNLHDHPHALAICNYLYNQSQLNQGRHIFSLRRILDSCPDIPSYEEVKARGLTNYTQLIRDPFERDMIYLRDKGFIQKFRYCKERGYPLTDEEIETAKTKTWLGWYMEVYLAAERKLPQ